MTCSISQRPARTRSARSAAVLPLALLALAACADSAVPTEAADPSLARSMSGEQHRMKEGALYVANLHPLNAMAQQKLDPDKRTPHGVAHGKAYFRVMNGQLTAIVDVAGAEPKDGEGGLEGIHPQHIHAADRCPSMSADVNGDGFVDVIEGVPFYGPILVPLDGNISNTTTEALTFPFATGPKGTYYYEESTSLQTLEAALMGELALETRHVVVHGVDLDTPLPPSVATLGGFPAQVTLPVACGEIKRVR